MAEGGLKRLARSLLPPAPDAPHTGDCESLDSTLDSWQGSLGIPYEDNTPDTVPPVIQQPRPLGTRYEDNEPETVPPVIQQGLGRRYEDNDAREPPFIQRGLGTRYEDNECDTVPPVIQRESEERSKIPGCTGPGCKKAPFYSQIALYSQNSLYRPRPSDEAILAATNDTKDNPVWTQSNASGSDLDSAIEFVESLLKQTRESISEHQRKNILEHYRQLSTVHPAIREFYGRSIDASSSKYPTSSTSFRVLKRHDSGAFFNRYAEDYAEEYGRLIYDEECDSFYSQPKPTATQSDKEIIELLANIGARCRRAAIEYAPNQGRFVYDEEAQDFRLHSACLTGPDDAETSDEHGLLECGTKVEEEASNSRRMLKMEAEMMRLQQRAQEILESDSAIPHKVRTQVAHELAEARCELVARRESLGLDLARSEECETWQTVKVSTASDVISDASSCYSQHTLSSRI